MQTLLFTLTRAQLEAKRTALAAQNVVLTGDSGQVSEDGVTLQFDYAEPSLRIDVLHKPGLLPEGILENKIKEWFSSN